MPNVNVTITMPEDATMEEAVELADEVLRRIEKVDGIATAGAMMSTGNGISLLGGSGDGFNVTVYITLEDETASGAAVGKQIEELCADLDCEVSASSAMMHMSMMTGDGISMQIYSEDMQALQKAAKTASDVIKELPTVFKILKSCNFL